MKRTFGVFSLAMLVFSTFIPSFTYALEPEEEEAIEFLTNILEEVTEGFDENHGVSSVVQSANEERNIYTEPEENKNPYIVYNANSGLITVYSQDFSYGVTLEDKNLGAENIGDNGYYYQRGNNNGNTEDGPVSDQLLERDESYVKGYNGDRHEFIKTPSPYIWSGHVMHWTRGQNMDNSSNNYGYDTINHIATNVEQRQGPCKEGFHVPSRGEWDEIIYLISVIQNNNERATNCKNYHSCGLADDNATGFMYSLKLPRAGYRYPSDGTYNKPEWGYYWSSSASDGANAYRINLDYYLGQYNVNPDYVNYFSNGYSVRCFKDEYIPNPGFEKNKEHLNNCFEYSQNTTDGSLILNKYKYGTNNCTGDIIIPTSLSGNEFITVINDNTFEGISINSIKFAKNTTIQENGFSGSTFNGDITIDGNIVWIYPKRFNVGPQGKITFKNQTDSLYYIINNGTIIIDKTERNSKQIIDIFNRSTNNGTIILSGATSVSHSFQDSILNDNGRIVFGDTITAITNSFSKLQSSSKYQGYVGGELDIPDSVTTIDDVLEYGNFNITLKLPNSINLIDDSFIDGIIKNRLEFTGNNSLEISQSLTNTLIQGPLVFSGINLNLYDVYPRGVSGNVEFINLNNGNTLVYGNFKNLFYKTGYIISGDVKFINNDIGNISAVFSNYKGKILGDLIISGNNLDIPSGSFSIGEIGGNVELKGNNVTSHMNILKIGKELSIKGNSIDLNNGFSNIKIGSGVQILGNYINLAPQCLYQGIITGDVLISGNTVDSYNNALVGMKITGNLTINSINEFNPHWTTINNTNIGGNLTINSNSFNPHDGALQGITISGDIKLPSNGTIGERVLNSMNIYGNTILEEPKSYTLLYTINKDLIILNGDNAPAEEFSGIEVGRNIILNGEISKVGNSSYTFKSGNILPITLTSTFNTGDIGENAFCMEGKEPVIAYTSKRLSQEEKEYLFNHSCINVSFNGKRTIIFNINNTELSTELNNNEKIIVPNQLNKNGYSIERYSDEELQNKIELDSISFNKYEYTKTIYGKYVEIPVTPSKGSGRPIVTPTKQETKTTEEEHNVADTEEQTIETTTNTKVEVTTTIKEKVEKTKEKVLSRGEIAVMTNILLEVYPKLTENKSLNEVSEACENYADDQDFTKDEKKAITRLCKLSIMGIHYDKNEPLDEFLVKQKATNGEFATVMNRVVSSYNEKDLSTIKEALKKLENDDEGVVFGTVYSIFMSIKNIFN